MHFYYTVFSLISFSGGVIVVYKYNSFKEYIQLNYIDTLQDALESYIKQKDLAFFDEDTGDSHTYDDFQISTIRVTTVHYTKNKKDNVEFEVHFRADYQICDSVLNPDSDWPPVVDRSGYFIFEMKGSFKKGFVPKGKDEVKKLDEQPETISSSLVPIISKDEMDSYATKFLKEFCPEALEKPIRLDVANMLATKGVKVYYAPLGDRIYGKTYFAKDRVEVYKKDEDFDFLPSGETEIIDVEPGTVLINFDAVMEYPIGVYRNTMVHEAIHWLFHSNYFELQQLLDDELKCAVCYYGDSYYSNSEIAWMEWQARCIAPRVLMPKKTAIIKWNEILDNIKEKDEANELTKYELYEKALDKFSKFFGVTLTSARIRLQELGINEVEGIKNFVDGAYIKPFFFKKGVLKRNQSFVIASDQLAHLLTTNLFLQTALEKEQFLYINKMLVVNDPKYVDNKKYVLTEYGLNHAHECCLIFDIQRFGIDENGELSKDNFLLSSPSDRVEEREINQDQLNVLLSMAVENASHFEKHKENLRGLSLGKTLQYHINKAREKGYIHTYEDLANKSDVDVKKIKDYRNDEVKSKNIDRVELLRLGLTLRLSAPYIYDLLEKGNVPFGGSVNGEITIFKTLICSYPRQGMLPVYKALKNRNLEALLDLSDKWKAKFAS